MDDPFEEFEEEGAGPSLSQLVYTQQQSSLSQVASVEVAELCTSGSIKKEQELIDDFYGLDSEEKAKKQNKSKRRRKTQSQVQETVEEKQAKIAKRAEIRVTRNRWKKRRVNLLNDDTDAEPYRQIAIQHIKNGLPVGPIDDGFWEHGIAAPSQNVLPPPHQVTIHKQMLPPETDRRSDFGRWLKIPVRKYPKLLFPFPYKLAPAPREFHRSAAIQIGRKGLRSKQDDSQLEYRILSDMLRCRSGGGQLLRSREMGQNMKLFINFNWKNTMKVAEKLGVTILLAKGEMPITIKDSHAKGNLFRAKLLRKYKASKLDEETLNPFKFEPGAVPPSRTLDDELLDTVFCSEDPNVNVIHRQASKIDMTTARAVFSTLMKELGSPTSSTEEKGRTQQRIQTFLDMLVPTCRVEARNLLNRKKLSKMAIPPVFPEYESLLMACSYIVANSNSHQNIEEDGDDNDYDDELNQQTCDYQALGLELCALLETPLKRPEVISFPRLFFAKALALIASELPSNAAKILATTDSKRPFETTRALLEFLETEKMFIEKEEEQIEKENSVMVGNLEHVFHLATEAIAAECQSTDYDVDHVAWTVALRLASVLLCSGNCIGGPSHVHRSYRRSSNTEAYFSQIGDEESCLDHEVRICMPKYEETRVKAAESMQKLFTGIPGEAQSNFIATLLQWSQAIALVTGPSEKSPKRDARYKQIRSIHAKHKVRSHTLFMSGALQDLQREGRLGDARLIEQLAGNVEMDPSCLDHWRELVTQLGPFAIGGSCNCNQCELFRNSCQVAVHHGVEVECARWTHDRKFWWDSCLLTIRPAQEDSIDEKNASKGVARDFCRGIEQRMRDEKEYCFQKLPSSKKDDELISEEEEERHEWLAQVCEKCDDESTSEAEYDTKPSLSTRAIAVDRWLPKETCANNGFSELNEISGEWSPSPIIPTLSEKSKSVERIALKICILVHLYGPSHKSVGEGVIYLAQLWRKNFDVGDAWACLCWLSAQGLHIPKIIRTHCDLNSFDSSSR